MSKMIFVNLPVRDLAKSTAFYEAVGATRNPQFSDETASCMVFSETIHAMLLTHDKYRMFTQRPIADAHKTSAVLIAMTVENRDDVDGIVDRAAATGGVADPNRNRITASCMAAVTKTRTAMSGKSSGWQVPRRPSQAEAQSER